MVTTFKLKRRNRFYGYAGYLNRRWFNNLIYNERNVACNPILVFVETLDVAFSVIEFRLKLEYLGRHDFISGSKKHLKYIVHHNFLRLPHSTSSLIN